MFLDQDDRITDDYLWKQKMFIKDADAVICNGCLKDVCVNIDKYIYADYEEHGKAKELLFYISPGNPVCSPGQVMLKRKAIPYFWCQHKLKYNGADDYLLWILMLKNGKKFVLNEEKLYTHVGHGCNASNDNFSMSKSICEAEQILVSEKILDEEEQTIILNRKMPGADRNRLADIIEVYDYWLYLEKRNQKVTDFLRNQRYFKIGIYGMRKVGNRLYDFLLDSDIETVFIIDRQAEKFASEVPVFRLEDMRAENYVNQADTVIVTVDYSFELIKEEIAKKYDIPVLSLKSILVEMMGQKMKVLKCVKLTQKKIQESG